MKTKDEFFWRGLIIILLALIISLGFGFGVSKIWDSIIVIGFAAIVALLAMFWMFRQLVCEAKKIGASEERQRILN